MSWNFIVERHNDWLTVHLTAIVRVIFPYPDLDVIKEHDQIWLKSPCNTST